MFYGRILSTALFLLRECAFYTAATSFTNGTVPVQCPYVSTCTYDRTHSLIAINDTVYRPCCTPCTSGDVIKMTCCPDISPCTLPAAMPSEAHKMCVPSVFNGTFYEKSILAIATCKADSDEKEKAMCLQEYDANNVHPLDILPVTDVNFETYRNVHCALCNGLQKEHVKFWSMRVTCETTSNIDMTNSADIVGVVHKERNCHINYERPNENTPVVYCSTIITSCNVTGENRNQNYDGCEEQQWNPVLFEIKANMIFKNGACRRCNGYNFGGLKAGEIDFPALSTLLDYSSLSVPDATQNTCKSGTVFTLKEDQCVELRCSLFRRLQDNICEKTVRFVDSFSYKLVLRVKVGGDIDVGSGSKLVTPVGKFIDTLLRKAFMKITDVVYEVLLVADTNTTDTPNVVDIMESKLLAIDVKAKVKNSDTHDPEESLRTLLRLISDKRFVIFVNQHLYTVSVILKDDIDIDSLPDYLSDCSLRFRVFENCVDPNIQSDASIVKIAGGQFALTYYGKKDNTFKDEFFQQPISAERNILEFRDCPFVQVYNKEIDWTHVDLGLLLSSSGSVLPYFEFLYGENDTVIWMCTDLYDALRGSSEKLVPVFLSQLIVMLTFTI